MDRAYTFYSQPTFVVTVHGSPGRFVFMADQWDTANLGASRCVGILLPTPFTWIQSPHCFGA